MEHKRQEKYKRKLQELTIRDDFMFGAVMTQEENCRGLLELALGFPVGRVKVSGERSMVYHPQYRGVRLDVYAKDEQETRYNVEMQVVSQAGLGERVRYYHSQIDMELLQAGHMYGDMPKVYVIFICDFDPFGLGRYRYTFERLCREVGGLGLMDGCYSVFLSAPGKNAQETPAELVRFLKYVGASLEESGKDFGDPYVGQIQASVQKIKADRRMEERYMVLERLLREERQEGREEGRKEGRKEGIQEGRQRGLSEAVLLQLNNLGKVPDFLIRRVTDECDPERLKEMLRRAAAAGSLEEFAEGLPD